jgi:NADH-ubiquinone oxidoreductase chain 4
MKVFFFLFFFIVCQFQFILVDCRVHVLQTGTTDFQISLTAEFSERCQIFLWIASFAFFAVKVPMVPVHMLLPEAHVGTYGMIRQISMDLQKKKKNSCDIYII